MQYRSAISLLLAAVTILLMQCLCGCSCSDSTLAAPNRSVVGTWTGSITRAADSLSLTITFTSNGSNTTGVGEIALLNEPAFSDVANAGAFLLGTATFPVTVIGNQATFTANFQDSSSTNVNSLPVTKKTSKVLIVIPGKTLDPITFNLTVSDNTLTGNYHFAGINGGAAPHDGTVSLTRGGAPPNVNGHWTGSMTSNLGESAVSMDLFLAANASNPNLVNFANGTTSSVNTSQATNTWSGPEGLDGILIGNSFFANINFVVFDPNGSTDRIFPHRYLAGTVNGNTISGTYQDQFTGGGAATDNGTFTLTKQTQ